MCCCTHLALNLAFPGQPLYLYLETKLPVVVFFHLGVDEFGLLIMVWSFVTWFLFNSKTGHFSCLIDHTMHFTMKVILTHSHGASTTHIDGTAITRYKELHVSILPNSTMSLKPEEQVIKHLTYWLVDDLLYLLTQLPTQGLFSAGRCYVQICQWDPHLQNNWVYI